MSNSSNLANTKVKHFYGRRKGHALSSRQDRLLASTLPKYSVNIDADQTADIDTDALFSRKNAPLWLEIGFGKGEHIYAQAEANPNVNFIGCEPFVNGVVGLLDKLSEHKQENIRIYPDDARDVLARLPSGSVERLFLLHPDPWPKNKHEKRRFVSQENLKNMARVMKDGAELRIGTDHFNYARWTMFQMHLTPFFKWDAQSADDWRVRPEDWPETRYQQKALQDGVNSVYLSFNRVDR